MIVKELPPLTMTSTVQVRKHHNMLWYVRRKPQAGFEKILLYPCSVHVHFSYSCLETSLGHMLLQPLISYTYTAFLVLDNTSPPRFHLQWIFLHIFHVLHTVCFCWTKRETKVQRMKCYHITCGWQSRFYYNSSLSLQVHFFCLSQRQKQ